MDKIPFFVLYNFKRFIINCKSCVASQTPVIATQENKQIILFRTILPKSIQPLKDRGAKKHALFSDMFPYKPYKEVAPPARTGLLSEK